MPPVASNRRHYAWAILALCFLAILFAQAAAVLAVASLTCLTLPRPAPRPAAAPVLPTALEAQ